MAVRWDIVTCRWCRAWWGEILCFQSRCSCCFMRSTNALLSSNSAVPSVDPAHISQRKIIICLSNQLVLIESLLKQQGGPTSTRSSRELGRSIKLFHSIGSMYWVYFPARRRWSSTSTLHFVCRQDHSTESHQLTLWKKSPLCCRHPLEAADLPSDSHSRQRRGFQRGRRRPGHSRLPTNQSLQWKVSRGQLLEP